MDPTATKAGVTAANLFDLEGNIHCFMRPLSSRYVKISVVSQCWILVAVQIINTQLFAFFSADNLNLLECTALDSDLVTVDAGWCRLKLLAGSRCTSPEIQTQIRKRLRQGKHCTTFTQCTLLTNITRDGQLQLCLPTADQGPPQASADVVQRRRKKRIQRDFQ